ncbi:MAG: DUF167 domain-containing protein [Prochlorotrichaceae cyanobacterium]|jgi:uncharacterized protein (TIGR00251 family)
MRTFVKVKPNAKTSQIVEASDGSLIVQLRSAPVDGKANSELIQLLAKKFGVPRSHITIVSGQNSRSKWIEITPY